jgi:hypothetical protein
LINISSTIKKLLYILLFAPLVLFGQEQDPCYSINDYKVLLEQTNPSISYQLNVGWNMVGYTGTAENSGIVNQINSALSNDATAESTFQVIKNVSGQFWSSSFAQISNFTQGEGYMMYVISETAPSLSFLNSVNLPEVLGCMDCTSEFYNPWATEDDGTCMYTVFGCTDALANNYNALATEDDASCVFDSTGDCDLPSSYQGNTGANMTVMFTSELINSLNATNQNAYIVALTPAGIIIGSEEVYGIAQTSISVWGDDTQTPELDGATANETVNFQFVNGTDLYNLVMPTTISYATNGLVVQASAGTLSLVDCESTTILGCTDETADNYYALATEDDGSCVMPIPEI